MVRIGLLDFLFPTLMAIDAHTKLKAAKEREKTMQEIKRLNEKTDAELAYLQKEWTDINAEYDACWDIHRTMDEPDPHKYMVWEEVVRSLPSFEPDNPQNFLLFGQSNEIWRANKWCLNLAIAAQFGKLRKEHVMMSGSPIAAETTDKAPWWGRERPSYTGQIYHEVMLEWHKYMKEHGFPYNLMVVNNVDEPSHQRTYDECKIITDEPQYRGGHMYYWDFEYNKRVVFISR